MGFALRILITAAGVALPSLLWLVPLPGWESPEAGAPVWFETMTLSVGALGLAAVLAAFVLVELVAAAVPRWRHLRHGQGRVQLLRVVFVVGAVLVLFQALYLSWVLRSFDFRLFRPGLGPILLDALVLIAGVVVLLLGARAVTRWGHGHGLSVVAVLGLCPPWFEASSAMTAGEDPETFARTLVIVAIGTIVLVGRPVRGERLPVVGLLPLLIPAFFVQLIVIPTLFVPIAALDWLYHAPYAVVLLVVGGLALGLPWLGARAPRWHEIRERAPAVLGSAAMVLAIVVGNRGMGWDTSFTGAAAYGLAFFVVAVTCVQDVLREMALGWRVELVPVLAFSDIVVVDRVSARLADADIAHVMRAVGHRTLLRIFGPWVPVKLLVERERAEEALRLARMEANRETYAEIAEAF